MKINKKLKLKKRNFALAPKININNVDVYNDESDINRCIYQDEDGGSGGAYTPYEQIGAGVIFDSCNIFTATATDGKQYEFYQFMQDGVGEVALAGYVIEDDAEDDSEDDAEEKANISPIISTNLQKARRTGNTIVIAGQEVTMFELIIACMLFYLIFLKD